MPFNYVTDLNFFKYSEFVVSKDHPELVLGIQLTEIDKSRIKLHVQQGFDLWRLAYPFNPMHISSGKRNASLNNIVGGSIDSDHLHCCACDIYVKEMTAKELFCSIIDLGLPYRQLICYLDRDFVHWAWNIPGREYKKETIIKG